jgi:hypothetical protein
MKEHSPTYITRPAYIPLPKRGARCPHTGLSHDDILGLVTGPRAPVLCHERRAPGSKKITRRLVKLDSLINYLDKEAEKQREEAD